MSVSNSGFGVNGGSVTVYQGTDPWIVNGGVSLTNTAFGVSVSNSGFGATVSNWSGMSGTDVVVQPSHIGITQKHTYQTGATVTTLWTPAAGKRYAITDLIVNVGASATVAVISDGATIMYPDFAQNGGLVSNFGSPITGLSQLEIGLAGTANLTVFATGYDR